MSRLTVSAAAFLLSFCMFSAAGVQAARAEKVLTVGVAAFPDNLSTSLGSYAALSLQFQTFEPLIMRSADGKELKPCLAVSWENPSPLVWRFHLRKGVKFHDGTPFSAADVKSTFDFILGDNLYGTKGRVSQVESVNVIDDYTVEFITRNPFPTLLTALSEIPVEPKLYTEKVGRKGIQDHPVGTGPFVFARWVPGDMYELTVNKDYWGSAPKVDRVVLRQISEGSTRVASLLAGETQIIEEVPIDLVPAIQRSDKAKISSVESTVGLLLTLDVRKPPFDNPKVREALEYAINKPLILEKMLYGNGTLLQGQMITSNTFGFNPQIKAREYNPAKAKQLLAEAGYPNGFKTSITTRSGKYLSDVDICNAVSGSLQEVGIRAEINVVEGGVFSKMIKAQDLGPIHIVGWYSLGDADFATVWFTQESGRAFWKNDEFERLFVEARTTLDQDTRLKAYNRMMQIFHDEVPAVTLFGLPSVYGQSKKLAGWEPSSDKLLRLQSVEIE